MAQETNSNENEDKDKISEIDENYDEEVDLDE